MAIRPDPPQIEVELSVARTEILGLNERLRQLQAENNWFREQYRLAAHRQFAPSSERMSQELLSLFNEVELQAEPDAPEPTPETVLRRVHKTKGKRDIQLANLETETVRHELAPDQQHCPQCSAHLHEMGCEVSRELKLIPARAVLVEHQRVKYACRACALHDTTTPVLTGARPPQAFPNSLASPSAVAYIISQKYEMGSPLYRLEAHFAGMGLELPRQNQANWVMRGADVLTPLYSLLHRDIVSRDILHADETTLQVLREAGREATSKSYMWVYCTGRQSPPVVLYDYRQTRASQHPLEFLKDFRGYLHADGYTSYDKLPNVVVVGCLAHARRNFEEALHVLPEPDRKKITPAHQGLDFCNRLFRIEREGRELSAAERFDLRQARSRPLLEEFHAWLTATSPRVPPKGKLGAAIGYCLNQWGKLNTFLLDGRLEIDNNRCERAVKPFVIGRKNWLFSNTPRGARSSATIYSMVETAKANGLLPRQYLIHLFERLPCIDTHNHQALARLLPWDPEVQKICSKSAAIRT